MYYGVIHDMKKTKSICCQSARCRAQTKEQANVPNKNLHAAKTARNDELYTQLSDIEKELYHYRDFFRDFFFLGLKKLISTHYEPGKQSYKMEIIAADLPSGQTAFPDYVKTPLEGDGDFRSDECIEILKEADVVVTNPPFSLFREYVAQLMEHDKKFIIIGNINAITYKEKHQRNYIQRICYEIQWRV